jgi:hypothetical protein
LQSIFPLGVSAGKTVDLIVRGTDMEGVTALWFDHPGLKATHLKDLTFRVVCEAGTPVGHHDVRVVGTYGISNPRTFVVGDRPEANEREPNNAPDRANGLAINSVVNGDLGAADVDCFAFEARKDQRLMLDLEAERVDSRLDATLRVLDASGREVAECRDAYGADPFVDLAVPADGRYVVKVHDVTYRGSVEHNYRLTLTDGPHLDAVVPALARPGTVSSFTLLGRNLGGEAAPGLSIEGRPLERKTVTIAAPAGPDADPACPTRGCVLSSAAPRRGFEFTLPSPSGRSNAVFLSLARDPIVIEREPNDDAEHAQSVEAPCDISGSFGAPNDLDLYRFKALKGEVFRIEASAERIGSPADPVLVVQRLDSNGRASELLTGDDLPGAIDPARFHTGTVDAEVRWTAPADGRYQVAVNDLYASQRGDVRLAYRLSIRRERPDFALVLVPDSPDQPDALTLHAGGRAMAYALAFRQDGFDGPIRVEAVDLPAGVRCEPVVIPAGQPSAPVVFEADESAEGVLGTVRLVGRARFGDRKEGLAYVPGASRLGPDVSHAAIGGGMVWSPPPSPPGRDRTTIAPARLTRGIPVKVLGPAPLALSVTSASRTVTQGGLLSLDLVVTRRAGLDEAVSVTPLLNPIPGRQNPPNLNIGKSATATYSIKIPKNLTLGLHTFIFQATGRYAFSKDPKSKQKTTVNLTEPSNPVSVTVRPEPMSVSVTYPKGHRLKAGEALPVDLVVTRAAGVDGPVDFALAAPAGLRLSSPAVQAATGPKATLVISAASDSPAGTAVVNVRATVPVLGERVAVDVPIALTVAK